MKRFPSLKLTVRWWNGDSATPQVERTTLAKLPVFITKLIVQGIHYCTITIETNPWLTKE
jgi:hypothetical protein